MNVSPYASGWCTACGRRRGNDGRCINCDPWWTSPLIQVGGPVLAVGSLFLVGLAIAVTPPRPDPAVASSARPTLFTPPAITRPFANSVAPLAPPAVQHPAPPLAAFPQLPASYFAPKPDPDAAMMESLAWLRYHVSVASGQMRSYSAQDRQQPHGLAMLKTQGQMVADQPL